MQGWRSDVPIEEYHAGEELSSSKLRLFDKPGGPAKVRYGERKETDSLRLGSLIHSVVLEPHTVEHRYRACTLTTWSGREFNRQAERAAQDAVDLVKQDDLNGALRVRDAVMSNPVAREILSPGAEIERSGYWTWECGGGIDVPCRLRTDILRRDIRVVGDLKSARSADESGFGWAAGEHGYDWQQAFYLTGIETFDPELRIEAFIFIVVEPEPPFLTACYEIEAHQGEDARTEVAVAVENYGICLRDDVWPGYPDTLETLRVRRRAA